MLWCCCSQTSPRSEESIDANAACEMATIAQGPDPSHRQCREAQIDQNIIVGERPNICLDSRIVSPNLMGSVVRFHPCSVGRERTPFPFVSTIPSQLECNHEGSVCGATIVR
jgi:hypothetical protein